MSITVTADDAQEQFSRLTDEVALTGVTVTVLKYSKPWVEIRPAEQTMTGPRDAARQNLRKEALLKVVRLLTKPFCDMLAALSAQRQL